MRKVQYVAREEGYEPITGIIEVSDIRTEDEISEMVLNEIAEKVHGRTWSGEWDFID